MIGAISESIGEYGGDVALATPIEAILGIPVDAPARAQHEGAARGPRGRSPPRSPSPAWTGRSGGRSSARARRSAGRCSPPRPARSARSRRRSLRPGSAVGVSYSSGDIQVGRDRHRRLHRRRPGVGVRPLVHRVRPARPVPAGRLRLPGRSTTRSGSGDFGSTYKLASLGHTLGALTNDTGSAVAGRVGAPPPVDPDPHHRQRPGHEPQRRLHDAAPRTRAGIGLPEGASPRVVRRRAGRHPDRRPR